MVNYISNNFKGDNCMIELFKYNLYNVDFKKGFLCSKKGTYKSNFWSRLFLLYEVFMKELMLNDLIEKIRTKYGKR